MHARRVTIHYSQHSLIKKLYTLDFFICIVQHIYLQSFLKSGYSIDLPSFIYLYSNECWCVLFLIVLNFLSFRFAIQLPLKHNLRGRFAELVGKSITMAHIFFNFPGLRQFTGSEFVDWTAMPPALFSLILRVTGSVVSNYLCFYFSY